MGWLFALSISIFLLASSLHPSACVADDRLTPGKSVSANETLVSAGGAFALGFFSPDNSTTKLYVGVWYNNIPDKTVVWVANREKPLTDPAGVLTLTGDRNIAVLDSKGSVVWSSDVPNVPNDAAAALLDSGNFVLQRQGGAGTNIWQSFDLPGDTFVPNMKLRSNLKTGSAQRIVAWKNSQDPSPGSFSFGIDPKTSLQLITWKGSTPYWRSHVWNGKSLSGARETNTTSQYVLRVAMDAEEISISFSPTEGSAPARYVLDPMGRVKMMFWVEAIKNWIMIWSRPSEFCDSYDRCGPSGTCDSSGKLPVCRCLQGFMPKNQTEWNRGVFTGGCVRRVPLKCDKGDKFLRSERMKLPDRLTLLPNRTEAQCQAECLYSCQCTAYAYATMSGSASSSRCLVWVGDLLDLEQVETGGEDLNVRLVASELVTTAQIDGSSKKDGNLLVILLPTLGVGMLILGTVGYLLRRRLVKQRRRKNGEVVLFGDLNVPNTLGHGKDMPELPLVDFNTIVDATNNFSAANKLGEGGFGPVYKGTLSQGQEIAVKRLSRSSGQGFQEFKNEVELIGRLQHTNLVRLLGWCTHEDEKILIYEYLPNKSLDKFIFDPNRSAELDWVKRLRIIEGIAQGLLYLHRYSRLRVIHRDLKTSNILLDGAMNPKISDFGLARIFGGNQTEANTNRVVGTYGYMSPEYAMDGLFSDKSDVFSFGVILLEIVTGKKSTGFYPYKESLNLLGYAWQLWEEGRCLELLDQSIGSSAEVLEQSKCIQLGLLCIQENAADRPAMSSVVLMLSNENAALPSPKQPAFAIGRHPKPGNSSSSTTKESVNELTLSVVEGR